MVWMAYKAPGNEEEKHYKVLVQQIEEEDKTVQHMLHNKQTQKQLEYGSKHGQP